MLTCPNTLEAKEARGELAAAIADAELALKNLAAQVEKIKPIFPASMGKLTALMSKCLDYDIPPESVAEAVASNETLSAEMNRFFDVHSDAIFCVEELLTAATRARAVGIKRA